jgi:hypothetical protein
MGITEIAMSRILKRGKPDFDTLVKMSATLEVPVSALFSDYLAPDSTILCPKCGTAIHVKVSAK